MLIEIEPSSARNKALVQVLSTANCAFGTDAQSEQDIWSNQTAVSSLAGTYWTCAPLKLSPFASSIVLLTVLASTEHRMARVRVNNQMAAQKERGTRCILLGRLAQVAEEGRERKEQATQKENQ
jgi:hypothetical protein